MHIPYNDYIKKKSKYKYISIHITFGILNITYMLWISLNSSGLWSNMWPKNKQQSDLLGPDLQLEERDSRWLVTRGVDRGCETESVVQFQCWQRAACPDLRLRLPPMTRKTRRVVKHSARGRPEACRWISETPNWGENVQETFHQILELLYVYFLLQQI